METWVLWATNRQWLHKYVYIFNNINNITVSRPKAKCLQPESETAANKHLEFILKFC